MAIYLPRRWRTPPPPGTPLNLESELAVGLQYALVRGQGAFNSTPAAYQLKYTSGYALPGEIAAFNSWRPDHEDLTFTFVADVLATGAPATVGVFRDGFGFFTHVIRVNESGGAEIEQSGNPPRVFSTPPLTLGLRSITFTCGASMVDAYHHGAKVTVTATGNRAAAVANGGSTCILREGNQSGVNGVALFVHDRRLSPALAAALSENPWALYQKRPSRLVYFPTVAVKVARPVADVVQGAWRGVEG